MVGFANAKINIGLQITSRRPDGYHLINTVYYPVKQLTDVIEIIPSRFTDLIQTGIELNIPKQKNLAFKAYELLSKEFSLPPVMIYMHKLIPFGAGLGGGSADATTVLKLLNQIFRLMLSQKQLEQYAARLGADCPFFVRNEPAFASGIGEQLTPIDLNLEQYNIVIIKPQLSISSAVAYSLVEPSEPKFDLRNLNKLPINQWPKYVVNDFERFLFKKYPILAKAKEQLYQLGALYASMSGSGSAIYGIFTDKVDLKSLDYPFVWQSFNYL